MLAAKHFWTGARHVSQRRQLREKIRILLSSSFGVCEVCASPDGQERASRTNLLLLRPGTKLWVASFEQLVTLCLQSPGLKSRESSNS